jgi:Flp pilus assembly protein TadG
MGFAGRRSERGAEMIETALALPILLAIIFGFYAFGRGWDIYQTMTRAAREGVRQAVTTSCATCGNSTYTSAQVQSKFVFPALQAAGINTSQVQNYTQGYTWLDSSDKVCGAYISFQYPYQLMIPFLPAAESQIMLNTDVQMRLENPPNTGTCP